MATKQSLGGGYGINRHVSGAQAQFVAKPVMRGTARHPGRPSASAVGKSGKRHFAGAKSIKNR